jgi:hypothetical protein
MRGFLPGLKQAPVCDFGFVISGSGRAGVNMRINFLALFMLALPASAEVYKWTDSDGQVHYGDTPLAGGKAEELKVDADSASGFALDDDARNEKRQRLLDAMQEDRLEKEAQREKNRVEKERRQHNCVVLKDRLRRAERASAMYKLDKDGNRVFYSDDQRKNSENRLREQIKKTCN